MRLRQPKVVGEILAGIVLGPSLIGRLPFASGFSSTAVRQAGILNFVYWLGLLLLMFLSGAETQQLFTREERREVGWLTKSFRLNRNRPPHNALRNLSFVPEGWLFTIFYCIQRPPALRV